MLLAQADKMRAKAKGQGGAGGPATRPSAMRSGELEEVRRSDRVARLRFPKPTPAGRLR